MIRAQQQKLKQIIVKEGSSETWLKFMVVLVDNLYTFIFVLLACSCLAGKLKHQ